MRTNPRDISAQRLGAFRELTNHPELLDQLVSASRQHLGFFTKHATRCLEYPWVMARLLNERVSTAIDIGAGVSPVPLVLAANGVKVQTVDYSDQIKTIDTKDSWTEWGFLDYSALHPNVESHNVSFADAHLAGNVDACYSISVIEHMRSDLRRKVIARAAELIRPGGLLILTVDLEPGTDRLWNLDRGRQVEDATSHGSLYSLLMECQISGFKLNELEIFTAIPHSRVDMLFCAFNRVLVPPNTGRLPIKNIKPKEPSDGVASAFEQIYRDRKWRGGGAETASGAGSTLSYTNALRPALSSFISTLGIKRLIDGPCGDFNWMRHVDMPDVEYIGVDIVPELIESNRKFFGNERRDFRVLDITQDPLPKADLMICRDCLFHLPNDLVWRFLENFARSEIPWLMMTTHQNLNNRDIPKPGLFRQLNFTKSPFSLGMPQISIPDSVAGFPKRSLGLWSSGDIKDCVNKRGL